MGESPLIETYLLLETCFPALCANHFVIVLGLWLGTKHAELSLQVLSLAPLALPSFITWLVKLSLQLLSLAPLALPSSILWLVKPPLQLWLVKLPTPATEPGYGKQPSSTP